VEGFYDGCQRVLIVQLVSFLVSFRASGPLSEPAQARVVRKHHLCAMAVARRAATVA
jgi:hypothetical protein